MKKLMIAAFLASSLIGGPGMLVGATSAFAQNTCDAGAPEAWFRPGGFCDAIGARGSLSAPVEAGCIPEVKLLSMIPLKGDRVHVAAFCEEEEEPELPPELLY